MVVHFVGHYFHYDSKFLQTLKTLILNPGRLTLAYWNRQRARYIPPISLYIFISAIYFLLRFTVLPEAARINHSNKAEPAATIQLMPPTNERDTSSAIDHFFVSNIERLQKEHGNAYEYILDRLHHNLPKFFFFMIPVMAAVLALLFRRQKDIYFADHSVFALHVHCFWFSMLIFISLLSPLGNTVRIILYVVAFYYIIRSLKVVYDISFGKALLNTVFIVTVYAVILMLLLFGGLILITGFS